MILACSVPASSQTSQADVSDTHGATTLQVHAVGSQIYECKKTDHGSLEWAFREPVATLMAKAKTVGVHFAGPSWRMNDGSLIKGAVVKQAPGTTSSDIPWLELKTTEHAGDGALGNATGIRRVETKGGKLAGTCSPEGSFASVPYEADYVFVKP
jgi:hypothetical protein